MATEHIVALLTAERDKLNKAIEALGGTAKRRGRPPRNPLAIAASAHVPVHAAPIPAHAPPKKKGRTFTAAQRRAAAERMRQRWAAKKKAEPKSPAKPKKTAPAE
jgi:hypothetical protein